VSVPSLTNTFFSSFLSLIVGGRSSRPVFAHFSTTDPLPQKPNKKPRTKAFLSIGFHRFSTAVGFPLYWCVYVCVCVIWRTCIMLMASSFSLSTNRSDDRSLGSVLYRPHICAPSSSSSSSEHLIATSTDDRLSPFLFPSFSFYFSDRYFYLAERAAAVLYRTSKTKQQQKKTKQND